MRDLKLRKLIQLGKIVDRFTWLLREQDYEVSDEYLKEQRRNINEAFEAVEES